jgi:hypothetical protein
MNSHKLLAPCGCAPSEREEGGIVEQQVETGLGTSGQLTRRALSAFTLARPTFALHELDRGRRPAMKLFWGMS